MARRNTATTGTLLPGPHPTTGPKAATCSTRTTSKPPFNYLLTMITPTLMFSVMLLAVLAVFSSYSRATRMQPQSVRR